MNISSSGRIGTALFAAPLHGQAVAQHNDATGKFVEQLTSVVDTLYQENCAARPGQILSAVASLMVTGKRSK